MQHEETVVAVVVAFNRVALLAESLEALAAQSRPVDRVVVVDNGSTDGTSQMVAERFPDVALVTLDVNTGGAGGFAVGIERALTQHGADWVWLMDDDTVPGPDALAEAAIVARRAPAGTDLVASRVVWTDGREHPMNMPRVRPFASRASLDAAAAADAYPVRSASFVSSFVRAAAVRRVGLPIAAYFLWNDDFEFSTRVLRGRRGYVARRSTVVHKTRVFGDTAADPGERFYLEVRNKVWLLTRSGSLAPVERALYAASTLRRWLKTYLRSEGRAVLRSGLLRGLRDGFSAAPAGNAEALAELGPELVAGQRSLDPSGRAGAA